MNYPTLICLSVALSLPLSVAVLFYPLFPEGITKNQKFIHITVESISIACRVLPHEVGCFCKHGTRSQMAWSCLAKNKLDIDMGARMKADSATGIRPRHPTIEPMRKYPTRIQEGQHTDTILNVI
jgi:hypothetical protein